MTRIILTAGKGGVGKSTVAAATAAACADRGLHSLVMSVDSAHNLTDLLGTRLASTPTPVSDRLHGLEVDINAELQAHWQAVMDFLRTMTAHDPRVTELVADECAVLPGMEEVFGLMRLQSVVETGEFDVVVVDAPPTGDLLKFLRLPDVVQWFMEKYHPLERGMLRKLRPMAEMLDWPLPSDEAMGQMEQWYVRVREANALLMDHRHVSVRLVMTPDRVALEETRRAFSWTCLLGMNVDTVILNRLLPDGQYPEPLAGWLSRQAGVTEAAGEAFADVPVLRAELRSEEVVGVNVLREFGHALYGKRDPAALWSDEPAVQWLEEGNGATLRLRLPFLKKGQFRLLAGREGLTVLIGNQRRVIPLPSHVRQRTMRQARYADGWLVVSYEP